MLEAKPMPNSKSMLGSKPAELEAVLPEGAVAVPAKKAAPKSPRRKARELALQSLYHWLLNPDDMGVIQAEVIARDGAKRYDKVFYETLVEGVVGDMPALREAIQPFLDRPQIELSPVEHAILLAAAFELLHHAETPYRVIINESIELAKVFGGTDGHKYVNGVLDKLAAKVRPHG
jgi:transcription antitermination protein NusB